MIALSRSGTLYDDTAQNMSLPSGLRPAPAPMYYPHPFGLGAPPEDEKKGIPTVVKYALWAGAAYLTYKYFTAKQPRSQRA